MQMSQRLIDGLEVLLHHRLSPLAVALFDALFNLCNRFLAWQDATDGEEARLHDGVDAPFQTDVIGNLVSIDHKQAQLCRRRRLLHLVGQMLPDSFRAIDAVEQEDTTWLRVLEDVEPLYQRDLVTCHKVC